MALETITVGRIRKLLNGLPDDQEILLIEPDGTAVEISNIDPLTVTDTATGKQVLTIEFETSDERFFGFNEAQTEIDSDE